MIKFMAYASVLGCLIITCICLYHILTAKRMHNILNTLHPNINEVSQQANIDMRRGLDWEWRFDQCNAHREKLIAHPWRIKKKYWNYPIPKYILPNTDIRPILDPLLTEKQFKEMFK